MRLAPEALMQSMARQLRSCVAELPAPASAPGVRAELLSISSSLRYLACEIQGRVAHNVRCQAAAQRFRERVSEIVSTRAGVAWSTALEAALVQGSDETIEIVAMLEQLRDPACPDQVAAAVISQMVEYLKTCNQSELAMYRQ